MSYSKDLRERAVKYYKSGHTLKDSDIPELEKLADAML